MSSSKAPKRPRDTNQLAKFIVDVATGEASVHNQDAPQKNAIAAERGRTGGIKGGRVRALNLSPEERSKAASLAAQARWRKKT